MMNRFFNQVQHKKNNMEMTLAEFHIYAKAAVWLWVALRPPQRGDLLFITCLIL